MDRALRVHGQKSFAPLEVSVRSTLFATYDKASGIRPWATRISNQIPAKSSGKSFTPPTQIDEIAAKMARSWPPEPMNPSANFPKTKLNGSVQFLVMPQIRSRPINRYTTQF
jgi:hypothetical protein